MKYGSKSFFGAKNCPWCNGGAGGPVSELVSQSGLEHRFPPPTHTHILGNWTVDIPLLLLLLKCA